VGSPEGSEGCSFILGDAAVLAGGAMSCSVMAEGRNAPGASPIRKINVAIAFMGSRIIWWVASETSGWTYNQGASVGENAKLAQFRFLFDPLGQGLASVLAAVTALF